MKHIEGCPMQGLKSMSSSKPKKTEETIHEKTRILKLKSLSLKYNTI